MNRRRTPQPRDYLESPSHFGRYKKARWKPVESSEEQDALVAAQWQHQISLLTNLTLVINDWTRDGLAEMLGRERQYIWDRLQGRTPMSVRDFAALERILQFQIVSPSSDEPLPVEMEEAPDRGRDGWAGSPS